MTHFVAKSFLDDYKELVYCTSMLYFKKYFIIMNFLQRRLAAKVPVQDSISTIQYRRSGAHKVERQKDAQH